MNLQLAHTYEIILIGDCKKKTYSNDEQIVVNLITMFIMLTILYFNVSNKYIFLDNDFPKYLSILNYKYKVTTNDRDVYFQNIGIYIKDCTTCTHYI